MRGWRIKTKRDWGITFVFAALLVYGITGGFSTKIDRALMYFTDPRLSDLNQPSSYGNVALTALVMGALTGIVLFVRKRSLKRSAFCMAAGCAAAAVSVGAYFLHCSLLVHVPDELSPASVWVYKAGEGGVNGAYDPEDEIQMRFLQLCTSLEELPKEEQKRAQELYAKAENDGNEEEIHIWIRYPEKYLHSYSLLLYIRNGQIFAQRDGGRDRIFFADNGLKETAEELLAFRFVESGQTGE